MHKTKAIERFPPVFFAFFPFSGNFSLFPLFVSHFAFYLFLALSRSATSTCMVDSFPSRFLFASNLSSFVSTAFRCLPVAVVAFLRNPKMDFVFDMWQYIPIHRNISFSSFKLSFFPSQKPSRCTAIRAHSTPTLQPGRLVPSHSRYVSPVNPTDISCYITFLYSRRQCWCCCYSTACEHFPEGNVLR